MHTYQLGLRTSALLVKLHLTPPLPEKLLPAQQVQPPHLYATPLALAALLVGITIKAPLLADITLLYYRVAPSPLIRTGNTTHAPPPLASACHPSHCNCPCQPCPTLPTFACDAAAAAASASIRWCGSSMRYSPTDVMYGRGAALKLGRGATACVQAGQHEVLSHKSDTQPGAALKLCRGAAACACRAA